MRKNLLIALAVALGTTAFAQNRVVNGVKLTPISPERLKHAVPFPRHAVDARKAGPVNQNPSNAILRSSSNNSINSITDVFLGQTFYDLQTNGTISNRLLRNADGTISAAWTTSCGNQGTDRGSGYNYWNGSAWVYPTPSTHCNREESVRVGFTNVAVTSSGHEMLFGHSSTQGSLNLSYRATKGSGAWLDTTALGTANNDTWAKGIAGGINGESVHIIAQGTGVTGVPLNGQDGPLYYYRSTDGGVSWPIIQQTFPGLDAATTYGFGGDAYSIDARGDVIAITAGEWSSNLYLLKSMDNGNTWTQTTVVTSPLPQPYDDTQPFPDLNSDGFSDTLELRGGDAHVMIDNNNMCHIWFSSALCLNDGTGLGYFPNALDGLYYWNENSTSPSIVAFAPDLNGDNIISIPTGGQGGGNGMGAYRGSVTQMPSSGIDGNNYLYLAYQSYCETCDTTIYPGTGHKQVYAIKSTDGGATWTDPNLALHLLQDGDSSLEEGVFACMARYVDQDIYVSYQRDYAPGHSLAANTTEAGWNAGIPSDIVLCHFPVTDIATGINTPAAVQYDFTLNQNQPNPARDFTTISFGLRKSASVKLEITDVIGKLVYTENQSNLAKGNHQITVNTTGINAGVYFYSLTINGDKITKKMIVE